MLSLSLSLSLSLFSHASWNLRETSAVAPVRSFRSSPPDFLWGLETREISRYTIRRRSVTNKLQPALGPSLNRSHFHLFPVSPAVQELEELTDTMVFERSSRNQKGSGGIGKATHEERFHPEITGVLSRLTHGTKDRD